MKISASSTTISYRERLEACGDPSWLPESTRLFVRMNRNQRVSGTWHYRFRYPCGNKVTINGTPGSGLFFRHYFALLEHCKNGGKIHDAPISEIDLRGYPPKKVSLMLSKAKRRAAKMGKRYDLNELWVLNVSHRQKWKCALSDMPLTFVREGRLAPYAPSIDRIDSDQGYTKENCRIVCLGSSFKCNTHGPTGTGCCDGQTKQAPQQRGTWRDPCRA